MRQIESKSELMEVTVETEEVFCDYCGEKIYQYVDYETLNGEHVKSLRQNFVSPFMECIIDIDHKWLDKEFIFKKIVCFNCAKKFNDELEKKLTSIGFEVKEKRN